jgi:thiol-disulfide isomerase/thioredoxin
MKPENSPKIILENSISLKSLSLVLGTLAGLLLAAVGISILPTQSEPTVNAEVIPAEFAPNFEIESFTSDKAIALVDFEGQGLVINFWASWCHPCREEMPALESAWQKYQDQGVVFIGVNGSDNKEEGAGFLQEYGVTFPNGLDPDGKVMDAYRIQGLPSTWFVNGDGQVVKKVYGPLDLAALDEAIALILPGEGS